MFLANTYQIDTRVRQEAKSLVEADYSVYVLAWDRERGFRPIDKMDGAIVRSFSHVNLRRFSALRLVLGALIFQILLFLECVSLIGRLRQRPIIHAHDFNTLLPGCLIRILRLSVGLVYDSHELSYAAYSEFFKPTIGCIISSIEKRCLRHVDTVITVSPPIANYLRRFNPATEIIYNCPRMSDIPKLSKQEIRRQLGLPLDTFIVSYVGVIRYDSKLDSLLTVASYMRNMSNVDFLVVGGGPLAPEFRRAARETPGRLTLVSQVPPRKALYYVAASDLTWAIYETRSLNQRLTITWKFFESLACRVPMIVRGGSYTAELVKKLRCGKVLESDDPNEISQVIISLANERAHHMLAADGTSQELAWEVTSRKLIEIYDRLRLRTHFVS